MLQTQLSQKSQIANFKNQHLEFLMRERKISFFLSTVQYLIGIYRQNIERLSCFFSIELSNRNYFNLKAKWKLEIKLNTRNTFKTKWTIQFNSFFLFFISFTLYGLLFCFNSPCYFFSDINTAKLIEWLIDWLTTTHLLQPFLETQKFLLFISLGSFVSLLLSLIPSPVPRFLPRVRPEMSESVRLLAQRHGQRAKIIGPETTSSFSFPLHGTLKVILNFMRSTSTNLRVPSNPLWPLTFDHTF